MLWAPKAPCLCWAACARHLWKVSCVPPSPLSGLMTWACLLSPFPRRGNGGTLWLSNPSLVPRVRVACIESAGQLPSLGPVQTHLSSHLLMFMEAPPPCKHTILVLPKRH